MKKVIAILFLFALLGCADDDENNSSSHDNNISTPVYASIPVDGNFADNEGDVNQSFVDLTNMNISISDTSIIVSIEVSDLPSQLTFNHSTLPDGHENYEWSVYFDVNDDGQNSIGDILICARTFKDSGSSEIYDDILTNTDEYVLYITDVSEDNNNNVSTSAFVDLSTTTSISGNTFIFEVNKSDNIYLQDISSSIKVYFRAYYNDGIETISDYYPDR